MGTPSRLGLQLCRVETCETWVKGYTHCSEHGGKGRLLYEEHTDIYGGFHSFFPEELPPQSDDRREYRNG